MLWRWRATHGVWLSVYCKLSVLHENCIRISETVILDVGDFLIDFMNLSRTVVIGNAYSVNMPEKKARGKAGDQIERWYLQFVPKTFASTHDQMGKVKFFPDAMIGCIEARLREVVANKQLAQYPNAPQAMRVLNTSFPYMNCPNTMLGGFIPPLQPNAVGGKGDIFCLRENALLVYNFMRTASPTSKLPQLKAGLCLCVTD